MVCENDVQVYRRIWKDFVNLYGILETYSEVEMDAEDVCHQAMFLAEGDGTERWYLDRLSKEKIRMKQYNSDEKLIYGIILNQVKKDVDGFLRNGLRNVNPNFSNKEFSMWMINEYYNEINKRKEDDDFGTR